MRGDMSGASDASSVEAALVKADELLRDGDYAACAQIVEDAIETSRRLNEEQLLGWAMLLRCAVLIERDGQPELAYEAASQAYGLLRKPEFRARAVNARAGILYDSGDLGRALEGLQQALRELTPQRTPESVHIRWLILQNLAIVLNEGFDEQKEAARCCQEALELATAPVNEPFAIQPALIQDARVNYAKYLCIYANSMKREGRLEEASEALHTASKVLTLVPMAQPTRGRAMANSLQSMMYCLTSLGRMQQARTLALQLLRSTRFSALRSRSRHVLHDALQQFHSLSGSTRRRLLHEKKLLKLSNLKGNAIDRMTRQRQVAQSYAELAMHEQALSMLKSYREQLDVRRKSDALLRCRLASIERRAERDTEQARQQQLHLRRLSVLGQLIGQNQHRLNEPLQRAHRLLQDPPQDPAGLLSTLNELNGYIDSAAALVSQLKLFSYRSRPQPITVPLKQELLDAWAGLEPHVDLSQAQMTVVERKSAESAQAWADPQRLAILFKIFLVELLQDQQLDRIRAVIDNTAQEQITLSFECDAIALSNKSDSLGMQLCMDIAQEMGGRLLVPAPGAPQCYRLYLPANSPAAPTVAILAA
jgi:tetratricopeptide (TPR) repeat protein